MMKKILFLIPLAFICTVAFASGKEDSPSTPINESPQAKGQEGNGGFVFRDKERCKKADIIIITGKNEVADAAKKAPARIFTRLTPPIDQAEFAEIAANVVTSPDQNAYRPTPNQRGEILMMDYKTDSLGTKYIIVYEPMYVALMYMEDQVAAKKLFQIQLIHEVLHHFNYSEGAAEVMAPILYQELGF